MTGSNPVGQGSNPWKRAFQSPVAERLRQLSYKERIGGSSPSRTTILLIWLGRQLEDHLGLEPGMLWVRVPPELLEKFKVRSRTRERGFTVRPRGVAEYSPACHAGDRGFKSHRGR